MQNLGMQREIKLGMRGIHWNIGAGNEENSLKIKTLLTNLLNLQG